MALLILGTTTCAICGEPIMTADAVGFPAFIPAGHEFERFSDAACHRVCFLSWDQHEQLESLFEDYQQIWKTAPQGLSLDEMEQWGKTAFEHLFAHATAK